ncbi:MAG: hypothetical protein KAH03_08550 [Cocleimonas sp.]|nr:hypothetical protein [Cocleimonas sp.]
MLVAVLVGGGGGDGGSSGGGGTIEDGVDENIKATVKDLTNCNPLTTILVDGTGDPITSFGGTLTAETGTPIAVSDGSPVDLWVDGLGRQVFTMSAGDDAKLTSAVLASDSNGNIMQVSAYDTTSYQNLDGSTASAISTEFTEHTVVRVKSYYDDNWITISDDDSDAVDDEGLLLENGAELTMLISAGNKIATIGGKLNVVNVTD